MTIARWTVRATRRRVVELLRREPLTVSALAEELGLTSSAVRVHVAALEGEGLVRRVGVARGLNRPAAIYQLAPGVDALLCATYVPFTANLLQTMGEELPAPRVARLMRLAGRRLASRHGRTSGRLTQRAQAASDFLNELGALTEVEAAAAGGRVVIRGYDCPLAAAVDCRPEVCQALESFVAELVRVPVRERCDRRSSRPRCRFELQPPSVATSRRAVGPPPA